MESGSGPALGGGMGDGAGEDGDEHGLRQLPRKRILLAGMVGTQHTGDGGGEGEFGGVGEPPESPSGDPATAAVELDDLVEGNFAEADDGLQAGQSVEGFVEPGEAVFQLLARELVGRRGAVGGGGDDAATQDEAVATAL
jgi:hypothetical protein